MQFYGDNSRKKGEQGFIITEPTVSGKHIKVRSLPDDKYEIEDIGSKNGTFVNGQRIIKKTVNADTVIFLGPKYSFRICDLPAVSEKTPQHSGPQNNDVKVMFLKLGKVYDKYMTDKISIQKKAATTSFMRMLPMSLIGIVSLCIGLIPDLAEYRVFIILAGVIASIVLMIRAYSNASDTPERMAALDDKLKVDYVCPSCKTFLGLTPFEGLKNKGQCPYCKTKWV